MILQTIIILGIRNEIGAYWEENILAFDAGVFFQRFCYGYVQYTGRSRKKGVAGLRLADHNSGYVVAALKFVFYLVGKGAWTLQKYF